MIQRYRFFVVLTLLATGCGGGGGGEESVLPGVWTGFVSSVEDTCGTLRQEEQFYLFTHLVNQSEENIILENGALTLSRNTTGEDSFRVEVKRAVAGKGICEETLQWRYERVKEEVAQFVVRTSNITCSAAGAQPTSCRVVWTGAASHPGFFGGGPIPLAEAASDVAPPPGVSIGQLPVGSDGGASDTSM